jgi:hypothetical protein
MKERKRKEVEDLPMYSRAGKEMLLVPLSSLKRALENHACLCKQVTIFCGIIPTQLHV